MKISRRKSLAVCLVGMVFAAPLAAFAQAAWPSKMITLVVPFPPGGQTDAVGRILAEKLGKELGQTVIVENRPGVNGSLGSDVVARATPDGYTLVVTGPGTHAINQLVNRNVKYDARKDFTHIAMLTRNPNVLLASPGFKGNNVQDVISQSKAHPNSLNFALTGVGSSGHISMELFKQAAGIDFNVVPYKGDAPAITDLIGGQVDLLIVNSAAAVPQIKGGKVRALAVTGKTRSPSLSHVPTMAEAGLPGVVMESWTGIAGPANLPASVSERLNRTVNTILAMPDVKARLAAGAMVTTPGSVKDAATFINEEVEKWSHVVKAGNIKAE
ncbi:Bug family tripartite tricarboxylate transporter substrate binding protein [Massilia niastensis]|uniref:Bug family tripartite tricarboxylate transporter substrate binding protein n=1 Tax=Massilia niastensis TaxID=544911 RepID=UPI0004762AD9|nr:tripartite tricarboxylate transporter substrate binding protein [Massilia niastensis]